MEQLDPLAVTHDWPDLQHVVDAIPGSAALLDARGRVLLANQAWLAHAATSGSHPSGVDLSNRYADSMTGSPHAARGVRDVLDRRIVRYTSEYPCDVLGHRRWFRMVVTPLSGGGALVLHLDITADRRHVERLAHVANHDDLTGLASRALFEQHLARALQDQAASGPSLGVLFIDVDDFKDVNDDHGHIVGDAVIRTIASRIAGASRHGDVPARFGGDEFLVLLPRVTTVEEVMDVARRLRGSVSAPIALDDGLTLSIDVSIGATLADPGTMVTVADVISAADAAMYAAKFDGKAGLGFQRSHPSCPDAIVSDADRPTVRPRGRAAPSGQRSTS